VNYTTGKQFAMFLGMNDTAISAITCSGTKQMLKQQQNRNSLEGICKFANKIDFFHNMFQYDHIVYSEKTIFYNYTL